MGYGTRRMLRRFTHLLLLPVLSGTLLVLSFPQYDLDFLAWIALAPLLIAIREKPWKTAFGQGWLAGLVFFVGTLSWVINAMHQYGKIPFPVSFFVMLLLAGYRSEEHTSELQSRLHLVCRLLLEKKKKKILHEL